MRSRGIERTFQAFDTNGDGVISMDELERALKQAGIPADKDTITKMVSIAYCNIEWYPCRQWSFGNGVILHEPCRPR